MESKKIHINTPPGTFVDFSKAYIEAPKGTQFEGLYMNGNKVSSYDEYSLINMIFREEYIVFDLDKPKRRQKKETQKNRT